MKFHQGLSGLLTLTMPFATVCYTTVTEREVVKTPYQTVSPGKVGSDRVLHDREMAQIQRLPTDGRKLLTENEFCDGTSILRTLECGKEDVIELDLKIGTVYTISVHRTVPDCEFLDPISTLFAPGVVPGPLATFVAQDDNGTTPPAGCDPENDFIFGDPFIEYTAKETGTFSLQTENLSNFPFPECGQDGQRASFDYVVVITCSRCGDNNIDPGETCDDGNLISEDGCSATCQTEDGNGGGQGDPHFKTWRGHRFDYHGECDLVLLHSSAFGSGLGLDVHVRTKIRHDMSFISSAAVRVGADILEVESQGVYYLNGEFGAALPNKFSGYAFSHTQPTDKQHVFELYLGGRERIKIKTYNDFVSVLIEQGKVEHFGDSVGLMGDFGKGLMLARDGKTVLENANEFGQEWQVLDTESSLFQTIRLPQHPLKCTLPPPMQVNQLRRRLGESSGLELAAEKACEHWGEGKDDCMFDVLATGDLEMAMMGAY
jgi:cysteine-rich repeat protein